MIRGALKHPYAVVVMALVTIVLGISASHGTEAVGSKGRSKVRTAEEVIPEARAAVAATERSYQSQLARFEAGTGLGIEVIEAQNARARARQDLVEAILRYDAAQMELAAGLGHLSARLMATSRVDSDPGSAVP